MKRMNKWAAGLLTAAAVVSTSVMAAEGGAMEAVNVAGFKAPAYDYTQANQLPMTGYYEKTLSVELPDGTTQERTVKFYISENACIRPYFTLIAVPGGVDTTEFLQEAGWFDIADANDECLFVMEPAEGQWGEFDDECAYVNAAIGFYKSPLADVVEEGKEKATGFFSSYGMNYFVGYGEGAPAMEAWAANNPAFMISQVYVDSTGVEQSVFDAAAEKVYDGDEAGTNVPLVIDEAEWIHYDQIPVPTWFVNCTGEGSINYWKHVNDCVEEAAEDEVLGQVFAQSEDSDAWQTEFAGPISKVAVSEGATDAQKIYDFLTSYTRYDNTCAFATQLTYRVRAKELEAAGLLSHHIVEVDGEPREYLLYVPANNAEKYPEGSPVVMVWPGNTQSGLVFMDATSWRTLADETGFICVYPCEQYNAGSSVTVSHKNTVDFNAILREELKNSGLAIDWTRIYSTGQSAGSSATNIIASISPEYYAAFASTSGPATITDTLSATSGIEAGDESQLANVPAPDYLLCADGDMPTRCGSLFDEEVNQLDDWAAYFVKVNTGKTIEEFDSEETSGPHDRFTTTTWNNEQGIPMTVLTMTHYRNHNCIHQEMALMWDYMTHFTCEWNEETGEVVRYYSPSAFAEDDAVEIVRYTIQ